MCSPYLIPFQSMMSGRSSLHFLKLNMVKNHSLFKKTFKYKYLTFIPKLRIYPFISQKGLKTYHTIYETRGFKKPFKRLYLSSFLKYPTLLLCMPFGRYKNVPFEYIPIKYINWLLSLTITRDLRYSLLFSLIYPRISLEFIECNYAAYIYMEESRRSMKYLVIPYPYLDCTIPHVAVLQGYCTN